MIVQKDDYLKRDGTLYRAVCCDEEVFIIGKVEARGDHLITSYEHLEAYSNDPAINTLADLKFAKTNKEDL